MELKKKFINIVIIPFIIGVVVNFVYDTIKSHSSSANRKSGYEFEIDFEIKFKLNK
ncbi:MAG: hypothetical protein ACRCXT_21875 [Paraclostridium sp.]